MSIEQLTWSLADRLHKASDEVNVVDELSLLYLWKYLSEQYSEIDLPTPTSVLNGDISLAEAYRDMAIRLGKSTEGFETAKLPKILAEKDLRYILREIVELHHIDKKEYVDQLLKLSLKNGTELGNYLLPQQLVDLMVGVSGIRENEVYIPFISSLQLAASAAFWGSRVTLEAAQSTPLVRATASMAGFEFFQEDPLYFPSITENGKLRQFPNVFVAPTFGRKIKGKIPDRFNRFSENNTNGDVLAVEHGLAQCNGRMVALVPQGLLFRGANDYDLRARLIDSGWLDVVINLPSPLLPNSNVAMAILIIDKRRDPTRPVMFIDADQPQFTFNAGRGKPMVLSGWEQITDKVLNYREFDFGRFVSPDLIKKANYDLSVRRYVLGKASRKVMAITDGRSLSAVAELIRGQLLKEDDQHSGAIYLEAGIKDIRDDGLLLIPKKELRLSGRMKDRAELQRLLPGDILIATKGSVGKVAIVGQNCGDNWVASQSFQVIRLRSLNYIAKPQILYRYLSSPLIQTYLAEQTTGTSIPVIKTADIKDLPVPQIPLDEQHKIIQTHNKMLESYQMIRETQARIESMQNRHWGLSQE